MRLKRWTKLSKLEKLATGWVLVLISCTLIGGLLNFVVVAANGWKMPVYIEYLWPHGPAKIIDSWHVTMTEKTRFIALGDIISLPCINSPSVLCLYSVGDLFLYTALLLAVPSLLFLFFVRMHTRGHGLTLLRLSKPPS